MKTATVTWTTYRNYGTFLQAYALQQKIIQLGHENAILSDWPIMDEFYQKRAALRKENCRNVVQEPATKNKSFSQRVKQLLRNPGRLSRVLLAHTNRTEYERPYLESQEKFDTFKKQRLSIDEHYEIESMQALNARYDVFICGSDQIWSVLAENFNPYYFLNFVSKKKIAYAPSMGTEKIADEQRKLIQQYVQSFDALSVRESISAQQLSDWLGKNIPWVVDPTLLHDETFWHEFAKNTPVRKRKYLLCYFLGNKSWYFQYAKKIAHKLHLQIVLIPSREAYVGNEYVARYGVGPEEFVSLIENASYVLTDSYHGSIFSVLFHRDFQYLLRFKANDANSQNIRIESLFHSLNLEGRIIDENQTKDVPVHMEYTEIEKRLRELRQRSTQYLDGSLKYEEAKE